MIEIQLTTALALYSLLLAFLGLGIWVYTELSVRRPQQYLGKQFLWRCTFCACTYLDEGAGHISQCPRCMSYNSVSDDAGPKNLPNLPKTEEDPGPSNIRASSKRKRRSRRRGPRKRR
jgi:hypothetical protein